MRTGTGTALRRRDLLLASAAGAAGVMGITGCAPPSDGGSVAAAEVYVGLGRARAVAILDATTDRVRGQIALTPLGARGLPWRIGVGPQGEAGVVPIVPLAAGGPSVGVIAQSPRSGQGESKSTGRSGDPRSGRPGDQARGNRFGGRCALVRVGTGAPRTTPYGIVETSQELTADARGRAYVLIGDGGGAGPSYAAVVDLRTGALLRHLPLASPGESVLSLLARPDGERLFAAVWSWQTPPGGWGRGAGPGRLVSFDTQTGQVHDQAVLPSGAAATDLSLAALPPTAGSFGLVGGQAVFAVVADPGPSLDDDWWVPGTRFSLMAFGADVLDGAGTWPLNGRPSAVAMLPDGARAYLLESALFGAWQSRLISLDLATGAPTRRWPMPTGAMALAVSPAGKAYVADPFGDRLWRVDTHTDTLLGDVAMPGAPIALAARP